MKTPLSLSHTTNRGRRKEEVVFSPPPSPPFLPHRVLRPALYRGNQFHFPEARGESCCRRCVTMVPTLSLPSTRLCLYPSLSTRFLLLFFFFFFFGGQGEKEGIVVKEMKLHFEGGEKEK